LRQKPFDSQFAHSIYQERYQHPDDKNWDGTSRRVVGSVLGALYEAPKAQSNVGYIQEATERVYALHSQRQFIAGGRYLYAAGRDLHQVNNCILLRCPDSREGWATTSYQAEMALMTGAGIGVWYGDLRAAGAEIKRTGGVSAGPIPKMQQINDTGRHILTGGNRRSAIWAGLPWWHADIFEFITSKDWSDTIKKLKEEDWDFPAKMDKTNISVQLDDAFFFHVHGQFSEAPANVSWHIEHGDEAPDGTSWNSWATRVYTAALSHMLAHGEPGFTIDTGDKADEVLRNACTEITSADDSDICNLGSLVLPRFDSPAQFGEAVYDATLFLTAGSVYSDVPYDKVKDIRESNRRLGLGLIGVHEFLMKNGVKYGTDNAFEVLMPYMEQYDQALDFAHGHQDRLGLSRSLAATAIAPNGTIGIVAESTPSADPLFSAAERRNVVLATPSGNTHEQHVVVDPTAARLVAEGVKPELIEDAHTLSLMPERRLAQQAFMQRYVDHAISSTVNLAAPITDPAEVAEFGKTLITYLPQLRGITCYPDGARAGQPRSPVDLEWALANEGTVYETDDETCVGGVCGV
jgi:ribonucleoside-diphosphate reductase alpha chain